MSLRKTNGMARVIASAAGAIALGVALAGCADLYTDRRDSIALGAGDAIAANQVAQMMDPWPAHSGNTNIPFNGQRMQAAMERYRFDKVTTAEDSQQIATASSSQPQNVTQVSVGGSGSSSTGSSTTATSPGSSTGTSTASTGQ
jgi:hypothetical protein